MTELRLKKIDTVNVDLFKKQLIFLLKKDDEVRKEVIRVVLSSPNIKFEV